MKGLLNHEEFVADQKALNKKYQIIYKELSKQRTTFNIKVELEGAVGRQYQTE